MYFPKIFQEQIRFIKCLLLFYYTIVTSLIVFQRRIGEFVVIKHEMDIYAFDDIYYLDELINTSLYIQCRIGKFVERKHEMDMRWMTFTK